MKKVEMRELLVTERGREIARPSPSESPDSPIPHLAAEQGATMPYGDSPSRISESEVTPAIGPPSLEVLDELREERL
jgi:hypothetical protein